jgi:hypothetical protein
VKNLFDRHMYGLAAIGVGICALMWRDFSGLGEVSHRAIFVSVAATIELLEGVAGRWPRTARAGAIALASSSLLILIIL